MMKQPLAIVWTGGIACGKSTALDIFRTVLDHAAKPATYAIFEADKCVHRLLAEDLAVESELGTRFGSGAIAPTGGADRKWLRENVFTDPEKRTQLEAILHPRVREECLATRTKCHTEGESNVFIADIPLYFDRDQSMEFDISVVVAASADTQCQRLQSARSLSPEMAQTMIASQLDIEKKMSLADIAIWNDGSIAALEAQITLLHTQIFQQ